MSAKSKRGKTCFVICPIGKEGSDTRRRSDEVLKFIVKPALDECGYETVRSDEISGSGVITVDIVEHLYRDDLVLADLTDRNPNVFYELGIRHAFRKPCVQVVHKDTEIPFDVAQVRTIKYDHQNLTSAEQAKTDLVQAVRAAEAGDRPSITPVTIAESVLSLRTDAPSSDRMLSQVLELLSAQHSAIGDIRNIISAQKPASAHIRAPSVSSLVRLLRIRLKQKEFDITTAQFVPGESGLGWIVGKGGTQLSALWIAETGYSRDKLNTFLDIIGNLHLQRGVVVTREDPSAVAIHHTRDTIVLVLGCDEAATHSRLVFEALTSEKQPEELMRMYSLPEG